ncbi:hypothetical protein DYB30_013156 [Aphanomyces astaci]|uniref:Uncharacterized protein n=1 Tax=Aphanomyces astaci TaxID=112090 RepID=A0A397E427_APHAT|nr:hypothetical protein DYB30_013156 [Aphanomyces astaci]RHY83016.1 hypothetical protein DYB26_014096 [Aphanomyces astaci]RHZ37929.1 hypothetical protein DYB31_014702 [Aphanomyces astaci]
MIHSSIIQSPSSQVHVGERCLKHHHGLGHGLGGNVLQEVVRGEQREAQIKAYQQQHKEQELKYLRTNKLMHHDK